MKKAFTLAEVMIALVVIGVITSILLPVAFQTVPDENVMKFKKGNATLAKVINELVTSDKYYADGDLGIKADGNLVDNSMYFCQTFADAVNTKEVNCIEGDAGKKSYGYDTSFDVISWEQLGMNFKSTIDNVCKQAAVKIGKEIVSIDDIVFYEAGPGTHFGITQKDYFIGLEDEYTDTKEIRYFGNTAKNVVGGVYVNSSNENLDPIYKIFCMDIDGIPDEATSSDCINECPFGYGIRADGKIILGDRAIEWLKKDIQSKDE